MGRGYSDETARVIDAEVRRLITEAHNRAFDLLQRDREILEELAQRLLEQEIVEREELRRLMGKPEHEPGDDVRPDIGHVPDQAAD